MVLRLIYKPPCDVLITPLIRGLMLTNHRPARGVWGGWGVSQSQAGTWHLGWFQNVV